MGAREELRLLNYRNHAPRLATSEFASVAGVTGGWVLAWDDTLEGFVPAEMTGGGGGAPTSAAYVTLAAHASLTAERVLQVGAGLTLIDGGANAAVTLQMYAPSETTGDLFAYSAGSWQRLAAGTSGQFLQTRGTSLAPQWATVSSGTTNHAGLSNLEWSVSGHTGTASTLAGFDGAGAATDVTIPTGGIASHAMIMSRVSLGF
jgi:hypothetical protein